MKIGYYIILLIFALFSTSCKKKSSADFGTVKYYPSFLWSGENMTPVTKTIVLDFNQDAQIDKSCFAEFQFVDNNGVPLSTSVMQTFINGNKLSDNKFAVNSNETSVDITFMFDPAVDAKDYQGYLKLTSHKLDRLDNTILTSGQSINVLQWTLAFEKSMNPLVKTLMWIEIALISGLIFWFLILKEVCYPRIRVSEIVMTCKEKKYYERKRINSARKVVVGPTIGKQSWFNKLFTGKIVYIVNPNVWTTQFELKPKKGKKVLKIETHNKYSISPITLDLVQSKDYKVTNKETNDIITIKI